MNITQDSQVEIRYRLFDAEGKLVEETEDGEPIRYVHGHEELLPGLERGLDGAEAGAELKLVLDAEEAYGPYNPEGIVAIPRGELPADLDLRPGQWIEVLVTDTEGGVDEDEMELCVLEVHPEQVLLDANHPLAGQRITFEVQVVSVAGPQ